MTSERARVLYMPNERGSGRQRGPRLALAQLKSAGEIDDVAVFSYLLRLEVSSPASTFEELCTTIHNFRPTVVLLQHPAGTGLGSDEWLKLRSIQSFRLVYHEGDAYDRFIKRIPSEMKSAAAQADVSFSTGASRQLEYLRSAGSQDARWTPQVFSAQDFGTTPIPSSRDHDVVMIANESSSRIPFRSIPGSKARVQLVRELSRRFGSRFAVYGRGWSGPSAKGPLDFLDQEAAVQSAWISANWDHYPSERRWFSDRLPISLAAGTIHVTSAHPGYTEFFGKGLGFLHYEKSVSDVLRRIEKVLDTGDEGMLMESMGRGRVFAHEKFRQDDNVVELLNAGAAGISPQRARSIWSTAAQAIEEF